MKEPTRLPKKRDSSTDGARFMRAGNNVKLQVQDRATGEWKDVRVVDEQGEDIPGQELYIIEKPTPPN